MIDSYRNRTALLIGNGINLLDSEQSFSWRELLNKLKVECNITTDLENPFKPFPLAFEEMLCNKPGQNFYDSKVRFLKEKIHEIFQEITIDKPGYIEYHKKITRLPYNDILTTNYDYSIEKSLLPFFEDSKAEIALNRLEYKYSLKRGYSIKNKNIWHIHGELYDTRSYRVNSPYYNEQSIMIGYEHYTSYLQKIQENIKGKAGTQKVDNQSLTVRLKGDKVSPFWTDIFFTHNLDILGLGLDFTENHLWWLINYRSNMIRREIPNKGININNNINYYYPRINKDSTLNIMNLNNFDDIFNAKMKIHKSIAIAELLNAFNVNTIEIEANSYEDFYNKFIERKQRELWIQ